MMPMFMLISDILCVCILLFCCLCLLPPLFMREGDQVKLMILDPVLAIRVFFVTCMLFPFCSSTHQKSQNTSYKFSFVL
jgi:hypothetical protein